MAMWMREFLESPRGRAAAGGFAAVAVAALFFSLRGGSEASRLSGEDRVFICSQTGKTFDVPARKIVAVPLKSPYSGRETGYPAELCYWTRAGGRRKEPVPVLLKSYLGQTGPTFCPDCGRVVVGHNPYPDGNARPPATRDEYARRHSKSDGRDADER